MEFKITHKKSVAGDYFTQQKAGETAKVVTTGGQLREGLASQLSSDSHQTEISPLWSNGDVHVYQVTVRGYTIDEFEKILTSSVAPNDLDELERRVGAFAPSSSWPMRDDD